MLRASAFRWCAAAGSNGAGLYGTSGSGTQAQPPATTTTTNGTAPTTQRKLEPWEMEITPEHKSLVLLLYREVLKGLIQFKSVRRKSLIAFARLAFRKRGRATEKLLIDECIEEARRSIYVVNKHNMALVNKEYKFDDMYLPKDTGQDIAHYMERVYDPAVSKCIANQVKDVDTSTAFFTGDGLRQNRNQAPPTSEMDKVFRPPPPPSGSR